MYYLWLPHSSSSLHPIYVCKIPHIQQVSQHSASTYVHMYILVQWQSSTLFVLRPRDRLLLPSACLCTCIHNAHPDTWRLSRADLALCLPSVQSSGAVHNWSLIDGWRLHSHHRTENRHKTNTTDTNTIQSGGNHWPDTGPLSLVFVRLSYLPIHKHRKHCLGETQADFSISIVGAFNQTCSAHNMYHLTLARKGGCTPLRFFADSEAPPGFGVPYGANLAQLLVKKIDQVRSRSYDVIRGTTSGNFTNKYVFYRTLTWRHCTVGLFPN